MTRATIVTLLFSLLSTSAFAARGEGKQVKITACEGKAVSESCSFEGRRGQVNGTCVEGRKDTSVILCQGPKKENKRRKNRQ